VLDHPPEWRLFPALLHPVQGSVCSPDRAIRVRAGRRMVAEAREPAQIRWKCWDRKEVDPPG
jgi:hypothetical protein